MSKPATVVATIPASDTGDAITPMGMLQIAVERGSDIDQLTKLMDLQERWEANEARKAFVAAKAAFKAEAPNVLKNKSVGFTSRRTNTDTNYDYATLDNVADTISPLLAEQGLSYSWETDQIEGGVIKVTCVLSHILGHSERVTLQAPPDATGNKNSIQQIGSTVTFLQRYTLLSATGIATKGQDNDGQMAGSFPISPEQKEQLIALMKETGANTKKFLKFLTIEALDDLPATRFDFAVKALESKRGKK